MAGKDTAPRMIPWLYDLILWSLSILVDLFFREVHPRGSWKVPRDGPVMFVAAPHANQFVDPLVLMRVLRTEAKRRISILTAAKSMKRRFIGTVAAAMGSVPVGRALDSTKPGKGKIYLPSPAKDPLIIRGVGTDFEKEAQIGGLLVLPTINNSAANAEILEIRGPEEIKLKREFKGEDVIAQLTGRKDAQDGAKPPEDFEGTTYKTAPKVDQTKVYDAVFERLDHGGCVCIFPEGGSHDRTELLPLKPGVAIMALGSLAANPDSGLKIVPCGMNYFHAHKFRSRAVVEFGAPIEVPKELVDMYRDGERREATRQLLEIIYQELVAVTVTSPDYDTLMLIQAARRLYKPKGKKLPLPTIVELNRRLVKGYQKYKDDPKIIHLKKSVVDYNKQLRFLNVRDHQVEYAKFSVPKVIFTLFYRLGKLMVMSIGTLPGLVLFAPVFIATKIISIKKSREALAASTVKLAGRDVMATWKLLVALALAPLLYTFYTVLLTYWTYRNRVQGYVPEWVPLWMVVSFGFIFFPSITFAALRIGEIGMDILKSIRPLVLSLNPTSSNTLVKLRVKREELSTQVTDVINTFGPEMFEDFEHTRLVPDPFREGAMQESGPEYSRTPDRGTPSHSRNVSETYYPPPPRRAYTADALTGSNAHGHLPRNESFGNLANFGLFATRPPSRSRSRSSSHSDSPGGLKSLSSITGKATLDEISQRIKGAMQERGKERTRRKSETSWEFAGSGAATPGSEQGKKDI